MKISIINSQKKVKLNIEILKKIAATALSYLKEDAGFLSVYIIDDSEIKRLNRQYRHLDLPTDVLAFSMREGCRLRGEEGILGDVVISAETAARAALHHSLRSGAGQAQRKIQDEMNLYLVHGILHLVGYDDKSSSERKKMKKMQDCILALLRG